MGNEVHPGHIVLAAFHPIKVEYDVMDHNESDHSVDVINEEGVSSTIDINNEEGEKLFKLLIENPNSIEYKVTCISAPVGEKDPAMVTCIDSFKVNNDE